MWVANVRHMGNHKAARGSVPSLCPMTCQGWRTLTTPVTRTYTSTSLDSRRLLLSPSSCARVISLRTPGFRTKYSIGQTSRARQEPKIGKTLERQPAGTTEAGGGGWLTTRNPVWDASKGRTLSSPQVNISCQNLTSLPFLLSRPHSHSHLFSPSSR